MQNKILVVANWKANVVDINIWTKGFVGHSSEFVEKGVGVAIAPPYTTVSPTNYELLTTNSLFLASQDLSMFPTGAYTGEISASMLAGLGVKFALVGHSERRKYIGETTEMIDKKVQQAISSGITPIICAQTLEEIPNNIRNIDSSKYLIMYEPASAISTEGNYHPDSIENIKNTLSDWKNKLPTDVKFLYGGSVSPENISTFTPLLIDHSSLLIGFVVGHASLDPKSFGDIIDTLCSLPA